MPVEANVSWLCSLSGKNWSTQFFSETNFSFHYEDLGLNLECVYVSDPNHLNFYHAMFEICSHAGYRFPKQILRSRWKCAPSGEAVTRSKCYPAPPCHITFMCCECFLNSYRYVQTQHFPWIAHILLPWQQRPVKTQHQKSATRILAHCKYTQESRQGWLNVNVSTFQLKPDSRHTWQIYEH